MKINVLICIDIGYNCKHDAECKSGNGGEYSKCNQNLNICVCTINHLGIGKYSDVCKRDSYYTIENQCPIDSSIIGLKTFGPDEDWYGSIVEPFSAFIHDKKTPVCFDPERGMNSLPDGFEIKPSSIPNAGLGVFTKIFLEQGTIFGPYKGILKPTDKIESLKYSWQVIRDDKRSGSWWIDGMDEATSNWLRYINAPTSASIENTKAFSYKGEAFYWVFKSVYPGTELLVDYGGIYMDYLGMGQFDPSRYSYAKSGYVGGSCKKIGQHCRHDKNTVCARETCFCKPGTHIRQGVCIIDETLGGICIGSDGETCQQDRNAECQRGVCVCKNNTSPANGVCITDETFGGRCKGHDGQNCLLDNNAECVHGLCRCKYGTTGIPRKRISHDRYQGRCFGED